MANQEHLDIVIKGFEAWERWRRENGDIVVDLSGANLVEADFSGTDLRGANLNGANLRGANLQGVDLTQAYLRDANLSGAFLNRSILFQANLEGAFLSGANLDDSILSGAMLRNTYFDGAGLVNADLSGADLLRANFSNADLSMANLSQTNLAEANFRVAVLWETNFTNAYLERTIFTGASLKGATLTGANLTGATLSEVDLRGAIFTGANLAEANLGGSDLTKANLTGATLIGANLMEANIEQAIIKDCWIYGISVWNLKGVPQEQSNLRITGPRESTITVDDLQVAQFVYLLLNNRNIRNVIDTVTSKAVLILGRFTEERKAVLDAISIALREKNYLPILFDFNGPESRNTTETVSTLAHMSKFIVADLTDPKCIPHELMKIVPTLTSVPVQPLILSSQIDYAMFQDLQDYRTVLKIYRYTDAHGLIANIQEEVIIPAETWLAERRARRVDNS